MTREEHVVEQARDLVRVLAGTVNNLRADHSLNNEAKKSLDLTAKFLLDQITACGDSMRVMHPLYQAGDGGSSPTSPLQLRVSTIPFHLARELNQAWHSRPP